MLDTHPTARNLTDAGLEPEQAGAITVPFGRPPSTSIT